MIFYIQFPYDPSPSDGVGEENSGTAGATFFVTVAQLVAYLSPEFKSYLKWLWNQTQTWNQNTLQCFILDSYFISSFLFYCCINDGLRRDCNTTDYKGEQDNLPWQLPVQMDFHYKFICHILCWFRDPFKYCLADFFGQRGHPPAPAPPRPLGWFFA